MLLPQTILSTSSLLPSQALVSKRACCGQERLVLTLNTEADSPSQVLEMEERTPRSWVSSGTRVLFVLKTKWSGKHYYMLGLAQGLGRKPVKQGPQSLGELQRAHESPQEATGVALPPLSARKPDPCAPHGTRTRLRVLLICSQRADIFGEGWEEEDRPRRRLLSSRDLAYVEPCLYIASHVTLEGSYAL